MIEKMKTGNKIFLVIMLTLLCIGLLPVTTLKAASASVKNVTIKEVGDGDFVYGISKAEVSFSITKSAKKVKIMIKNSEGQMVFTRTFKKVKGNKTYTMEWNGRTTKGASVNTGSYSAVVQVGKNKLQSTESVYFYASSEFAKGNGSGANPYEVATAEQLKAIAKHNGRQFRQTADIDCAGTTYLTLFSNEDPFSGVYDGQGHTIKNISISGNADYAGLFRDTTSNSVIKNLNLTDCIVSGREDVGVLTGVNRGTISNCSAANCVVNASKGYVGTYAGENLGKIISCRSDNNTVSSTSNYVGTIAGYVSATGYINECSATNDVVSGCNSTGGIAGRNDGSVLRCIARDVTVKGEWYVGGIAGTNNGAIANCEVYDEKALIKGRYNCHGIMGDGNGASSNNAYYGELS